MEWLTERVAFAPGGVNIGVIYGEGNSAISIDTGLNDTGARKVLPPTQKPWGLVRSTGLSGSAFRLDSHFPGAGENLACNQKRQDRADDPVPRDFAFHQVIVVTAVAVAKKIGVVFVKPNLLAFRQVQISPARAFGQNAFSRFVLADDLPDGRAFRR